MFNESNDKQPVHEALPRPVQALTFAFLGEELVEKRWVLQERLNTIIVCRAMQSRSG